MDAVAVLPIIVGRPIVAGYEGPLAESATMAAEYMAAFHVGSNAEYGSPARFDHPLYRGGDHERATGSQYADIQQRDQAGA